MKQVGPRVIKMIEEMVHHQGISGSLEKADEKKPLNWIVALLSQMSFSH